MIHLLWLLTLGNTGYSHFTKIPSKQSGGLQWEWPEQLALTTPQRWGAAESSSPEAGAPCSLPGTRKVLRALGTHRDPTRRALGENGSELLLLQTFRKSPSSWIRTEGGMFTPCSHRNTPQQRQQPGAVQMVYDTPVCRAHSQHSYGVKT